MNPRTIESIASRVTFANEVKRSQDELSSRCIWFMAEAFAVAALIALMLGGTFTTVPTVLMTIVGMAIVISLCLKHANDHVYSNISSVTDTDFISEKVEQYKTQKITFDDVRGILMLQSDATYVVKLAIVNAIVNFVSVIFAIALVIAAFGAAIK